jgi:serine/threonine protein kinase
VTYVKGETSRVGELLADKYRITRFVGEGGMGAVYEAHHEVVGRRFAVKLLHSELAHQEEILERFRREALAAGALESENIASIVDFGHAADGIPYIVMELLVGEDLARFLAREGSLPVVRAVNIIIQACRGLDAAHAAGIIHRDLKPENLFVCRRGDGTDLVKILDFGIAKLAQAGAEGPIASVTRTGSTMGTPFYMSPEQARGAKEVDHRADIYGLGVILFEALTSQKPHPGDSYNAILYHILTQPPTPITTLRSGLPPDLIEVVHRALSFEPAERPTSAIELARLLSPYAGRQLTPIHSQFELRVARNSATRSNPSPESSTMVGSATPLMARRGRVWWAVAAVMVLAAMGATAALLLRHRAGGAAPDEGPSPTTVEPRLDRSPIPASPAAESPPAAVKDRPIALPSAVVPPSKRETTSVADSPRRAPAKRPARSRAKEPAQEPNVGPVFDGQNPYR